MPKYYFEVLLGSIFGAWTLILCWREKCNITYATTALFQCQHQ